MKYPPYASYKPSGVEWLGNVPEHWEVRTVWHLFYLGRGRVISHEDIEANPGEYPVYSSQTENNGMLGCLATYDFEGDYVSWTTDGANAGTVFCRTGRFNCTNVCGTLRPKNVANINNRFTTYTLNLATGEFVRHDINPKLMNNVMAKIRFAVPSQPEQTAIATYLDRETSRIDLLVTKKRQLIAKLKEKRTALISHSVTRGLPPEAARAAGLDPHPNFKPSGIEWVGDVPEHWNVCAVWHLFYLGRGRVISHEDIHAKPGEYPVYSSQTENNGILGYLDTFDFEGDYITWTTDGANAGTVFCRTGRFNCTNVCGTLKPKSTAKIDNRFANYALNLATGEFVRHDINPKLMNNVMAKIRFGVPNKPEQAAIANYLDRQTSKIDRMVEKVKAAIERLQEYRTALITAAVTGKIDVRGAAPMNTSTSGIG